MSLIYSSGNLLRVEDMSLFHDAPTGRRTLTVATSLQLERGGSLAIVGESGSGKSLTAKAIAGLLPPGVRLSGSIRLEGEELTGLAERDWQRIRGRRISMLLQDPFTMMNPVMRCGAHIEEMLRDQPEFRSRSARRAEVARRLAEVGINDASVADRLPFQLSGGMCQRVALAAALARDPEILIADEPSTALDVTTQAEIMRLLNRAQAERGMALILITHDLRLAFSACERVCVFYAGQMIEVGAAPALAAAPFHPYTTGLLLSEPPASRRVSTLVAIPGRVPPADAVENECPFSDRCRWVVDAKCRTTRPPLVERTPARFTACVRQPEIQGELDALRTAALEAANEPEPVTPENGALVHVAGLCKSFGGKRPMHALKGVSLSVGRGECLGLVGESGSGKTTLGRCLVGLETPTSGQIVIEGIPSADFEALARNERARVRQTIQMIFQDPYATLNPKHSVGRALEESLRMSQRTGRTQDHVRTLLSEVGLTEAYAGRYPSELSGGERQRVAIARSLAVDPAVLVCDEPVSALDVSVQAQVLNLFKSLMASRELSLLFITHDLAVVRQIADRICVIYLGEIVEEGPCQQVLNDPQHPYTRRLISAIPAPAH
ncbi:putative ABC transporter, ATP-binding protein [Rubellimicrobium mesophilum DSM 19309]|uniref:Putative ABC transporter, ATP-binding protein n=1 Tax=Rubellimicrobium mesophilum DSM 19309 TaxID=442562 RepID=A0A017HSX5_9RHOB|nr:ABC transporter ATP-binding protein [Rubellimicrobium mesophilum]EYD77476.1 putative ABC transporter, ATP-binding protein [Rubellimicrobium mesophilum DSM 19309]